MENLPASYIFSIWIMSASLKEPSMVSSRRLGNCICAFLSTSSLLGLLLQNQIPPCSFYRAHGVVAYILVYVDDIVSNRNNSSFLESISPNLVQNFQFGTLAPWVFSLAFKSLMDLAASHTLRSSTLPLFSKMLVCSTVNLFLHLYMAVNSKLHTGDLSLITRCHVVLKIVGALQYVTLTRPDSLYRRQSLPIYA